MWRPKWENGVSEQCKLKTPEKKKDGTEEEGAADKKESSRRIQKVRVKSEGRG